MQYAVPVLALFYCRMVTCGLVHGSPKGSAVLTALTLEAVNAVEGLECIQ